MYSRYCKDKVITALGDTPVVIISGPRQSGKTTLAKQIQVDSSVYITLDDITQYDAAQSDPIGFIRNLESDRIIIDEVQRVPELFLAIKQSVDEERVPGKYLLTGSSNAMMLPTLSDSLAGRIEIINLLPLTTCEINGISSTFIDKILKGNPPAAKTTRILKQLTDKILTGGFPEPVARKQQTRKSMWYQQYINSIIQKDIRDLADIEHLEVMPKVVRLLANQVGQLTNYTEIAKKVGVTRQTVASYVKLLEQLYIFEALPAWHKNENKRLVKTPKMHIVDSGLLCSIKRLNEDKIKNNHHIFGALLESYVVNEIKRIATWSDEPLEFSHYRDKDKVEVDLVIETCSGDVIGIEIKAGATVTSSDFKGLRKLKSIAGNQFLMGIILYDGDNPAQHEEKLFSIPLASLWE